jgi:hypothetical protein
MAANKIVSELQLPEGYTVRKVKGVLKVVSARVRKAVIVEEKAMLNAVRTTYGKHKIFDWQESLKDTVLANREAIFTADEMYSALESVVQGDDYFESKQEVIRRLEFLSVRTLQIRLEKVAVQTYKFRFVG